ncbi:TPA: DNA-directed RNA polymerase [Vibrio parahaemolyticus]
MKTFDTFLKLSPAAAARINNKAEAIINAASCRLPMIVKPVEWKRGMTDGGAYLTSHSPLSLFKTHNRELLKELRENKHPEFDHFLRGHNTASASGFRIDKETLKLLQAISKSPRKFAKLPSFAPLGVECPLMEDDLELAEKLLKARPSNQSIKDYKATLGIREKAVFEMFVAWRKEKAKIRQKAVEQAGAQSNFLRTLEIAEELKDYPSIYFPTQSDDRGRVYYATPLLNPQGADHEKALLKFDIAKKVGADGWDWMRINLSNLMGNDKANFEDRIAYVESHKEVIKKHVANPFANLGWEEMDYPFQYLQAAREVVKAWEMEDPTQFESDLGMAMDASCSGLQILGTLTRCESSMKFTNCLPAELNAEGKEYMQDIYGEAARIAGLIMADVVKGVHDARKYKTFEGELTPKQKEEARKVAEQRKQDIEHAQKLLNWSYAMKDEHSFTRSWLKRNTMTFFYGSAQFGMREQQIVDHIEPEYNKALEAVGLNGDVRAFGFPWATLKEAKDAATVAGNVNYDAICQMADRPSRVMKSLQRYAELIAKSGRKMRWTTPLGLIVEQRYEKVEKFKVDSKITGTKRLQTTTQRSTGEVDANGQKNGAAPNWVHSLDASLLLKVLSLGSQQGLKHWRIVHDSFAVHAADTTRMITLLKNTMADMLDRDLLKRTAEELEAQIDEEYKSEIIPFPELGDESLVDKLRIAQYPFC